jgi:hypothetical protein
MEGSLSIIQAIQLILAPAVMINACGLLLLGISNRYSMILTRVRSLNEEKRRIAVRLGDKNPVPEDTIRLESIARQIERLLVRAAYARNAVLSYLGGVGLFVFTSLLIGTDYFTGTFELRYTILGAFLAGIAAVMVGVIYALLDTLKAYEVIRFDVMVDQ